jgi:hypothetical protein
VRVVDCVRAAVLLPVAAGVRDGDRPGASELDGVCVCDAAADAVGVTSGVSELVTNGASELDGVCVVVATLDALCVSAALPDALAPTDNDADAVVVGVAALDALTVTAGDVVLVPVAETVEEKLIEAVIVAVTDGETPVVSDAVGVGVGHSNDVSVTEPAGPVAPLMGERGLNRMPLATTPKLALTQLLPPPPPLWKLKEPAEPPPPPNQPAPPPPPLATLT